MTDTELGAVVLALLLLMTGAHLLGQLFTRMRQPKVVGEILAGVLLGPTLLGRLAPGFVDGVFGAGPSDPRSTGLGLLYDLGLILLMFVSGFSVRHVLDRDNRRPTAWILALAIPLPFLATLAAAPFLPLEKMVGSAGSESALVLLLAAAAAVTSIPVLTKIFSDLGILQTRFAGLLLGTAVLQDILLWGVLSIAVAIAHATLSAQGGSLAGTITSHVAVNTAFVLAALTVAPSVLRRLSAARWNRLASQQPIAWALAVLFGYVALAAALEVTIVFAAFLAGFGLVGGMHRTESERFKAPLDNITSVSTSLFIPVYFALVGYSLDFSRDFNLAVFGGFLIGSSIVHMSAVALATRCAGFRGLDVVNIAIAHNARGGPGIVMASVAFSEGIVNLSMFTALVLTSVVTSQAAGFWLDRVLRNGWPLLSGADLRKRGIEPETETPAEADAAPAPVPTAVNGHAAKQPVG